MNKNKNFRKSAIVIPALALMVLTAGASATGAVAWFTANRAATVTASTFTAYAPQANLNVTAAAVNNKGTYVSSDDSKTVNVKSSESGSINYLRDASYDASTSKLWRANVDDSTNTSASATVTSFSEVTNWDTGATVTDSNPTASTKHSIFYAVQWTLTFTYNNPNTNGTALFFDVNNSKFTNNSSNTSQDISKGFRIAMNSYTAGTSLTDGRSTAATKSGGYLVWANDKSNTPVKTRVVGSDSTTTSEYADTNFVQTSYTAQNDGLSSTALANISTYIGTFKASTDSITVTCTAWYEGTDATNVITSKAETAEAITASMKFYVRDLAA